MPKIAKKSPNINCSGLTVEKVRFLKNISKVERSEQEKFSAQLAACLLLKGLAGQGAAAPKLVKDPHNIKIGFVDRLSRTSIVRGIFFKYLNNICFIKIPAKDFSAWVKAYCANIFRIFVVRVYIFLR